MTVLGINCTTENMGLAVITADGAVCEKNINAPTIQAEDLIIYLDELLKTARQSLNDLEKIGIAIGPGAFTGLRLSLILAKTIALEQQIPLVPISTLEGLVRQAGIKSGQKTRVVLKACRGDVSTALFAENLKRLEPDHPVKETDIKPEKNTLILKDLIPSAKTIAELAQAQKAVFNRNEILKMVPSYSHEARVNKTARPELQHLKIGLN